MDYKLLSIIYTIGLIAVIGLIVLNKKKLFMSIASIISVNIACFLAYQFFYTYLLGMPVRALQQELILLCSVPILSYLVFFLLYQLIYHKPVSKADKKVEKETKKEPKKKAKLEKTKLKKVNLEEDKLEKAKLEKAKVEEAKLQEDELQVQADEEVELATFEYPSSFKCLTVNLTNEVSETAEKEIKAVETISAIEQETSDLAADEPEELIVAQASDDEEATEKLEEVEEKAEEDKVADTEVADNQDELVEEQFELVELEPKKEKIDIFERAVFAALRGETLLATFLLEQYLRMDLTPEENLAALKKLIPMYIKLNQENEAFKLLQKQLLDADDTLIPELASLFTLTTQKSEIQNKVGQQRLTT
ncbi:MAG: hypothetical protein LBS33_01670 [Streptococcaceae bacterium]|nr:hypothetical protein [Streptococcaceae bacterium]